MQGVNHFSNPQAPPIGKYSRAYYAMYVSVYQVSEDVYECSYKPSHADTLSISVLYDGQPVAQSPYQVDVGPVSQCAMKAYGAGLADGVAGFPATFIVQTNDESGTLGKS